MFENYLGNKTAWKILRLLSQAPGKGISIKQIKQLTKAGNFALSNSIALLVKYKILNTKKVGKKNIYWLNTSNPIVRKLIELFDIESNIMKGLPPSMITMLSKVVEQIVESINPKKVILFGSYAKGTASLRSDIDLCMIVDKKLKKYRVAISKLPENVQVHLFTEQEFGDLRKNKDPLIEDIILDGIELL